MKKRRDSTAFVLEAKRKIKEAYETLPIFQRNRSEAIYNYIAVLETEAARAALSKDPVGAIFQAHRCAVESSSFAILDILSSCPDGKPEMLQVQPDVLEEARQLFDFSYRNNQVQECFRLAEKGHFRIFIPQKDRRITFGYSSSAADEADTFLRTGEFEALRSTEHLTIDEKGFQEAFKALNEKLVTCVRSLDLKRSELIYDDHLYSIMQTLSEHFTSIIPIRMEPSVALGNISFADLRKFWGALIVITRTHCRSHDIVSRGDLRKYPIQSAVLRNDKTPFVEHISRVSGVALDLVQTIIGWYTYSPRISGRLPILQPFVPLLGDELCLPSLFVHCNNFERNFSKLMHIHPELRTYRSSVESRKEDIALKYLAKLFRSPQYRTKERVSVLRKTDADLVVYDFNAGFALIIQHKWLIEPESFDESSANDQKLLDGVRQAVLSRDYFRATPTALRTAFNLSDKDAINHIEAVTVCRGFEHTGFLGYTSVPVIMESIFKRFMENSHSLQEVWLLLNSRPDRTKAADEAIDTKASIELCGYEFVMPVLAYK